MIDLVYLGGLYAELIEAEVCGFDGKVHALVAAVQRMDRLSVTSFLDLFESRLPKSWQSTSNGLGFRGEKSMAQRVRACAWLLINFDRIRPVTRSRQWLRAVSACQIGGECDEEIREELASAKRAAKLLLQPDQALPGSLEKNAPGLEDEKVVEVKFQPERDTSPYLFLRRPGLGRQAI